MVRQPKEPANIKMKIKGNPRVTGALKPQVLDALELKMLRELGPQVRGSLDLHVPLEGNIDGPAWGAERKHYAR